jgi:transcriptional regulator with XRE-family HTH domain
MRGRSPEIPELRRKQTEAVKTIGARLKASRELSNLSLSEAARRLGYSNPSKLSKVENATDTNSVPLWLIRDAAELYEVSTEYLFGLSDDWECGAHRGMTPYLLDQWDRMRSRDLQALIALQQHVEAATAVIPAIQRDAQGVIDAINRLADLNGDEFLELRGGSILTAAANRLKKSAGDALEAERRLHLVLAEPAAIESTDET